MGNGEDNGVRQRINVLDNNLEFITMFDTGYPDINIRKYGCRKEIE